MGGYLAGALIRGAQRIREEETFARLLARAHDQQRFQSRLQQQKDAADAVTAAAREKGLNERARLGRDASMARVVARLRQQGEFKLEDVYKAVRQEIEDNALSPSEGGDVLRGSLQRLGAFPGNPEYAGGMGGEPAQPPQALSAPDPRPALAAIPPGMMGGLPQGFGPPAPPNPLEGVSVPGMGGLPPGVPLPGQPPALGQQGALAGIGLGGFALPTGPGGKAVARDAGVVARTARTQTLTPIEADRMRAQIESLSANTKLALRRWSMMPDEFRLKLGKEQFDQWYDKQNLDQRERGKTWNAIVDYELLRRRDAGLGIQGFAAQTGRGRLWWDMNKPPAETSPLAAQKRLSDIYRRASELGVQKDIFGDLNYTPPDAMNPAYRDELGRLKDEELALRRYLGAPAASSAATGRAEPMGYNAPAGTGIRYNDIPVRGGGGALSIASVDQLAKQYGLRKVSGYRPGARTLTGKPSAHGQIDPATGEAFAGDYQGAPSQMRAFAEALTGRPGVTNILYAGAAPFSNGKRQSWNAPGLKPFYGQHVNHVHVTARGSGGTGTGSTMRVRADIPVAQLPGEYRNDPKLIGALNRLWPKAQYGGGGPAMVAPGSVAGIAYAPLPPASEYRAPDEAPSAPAATPPVVPPAVASRPTPRLTPTATPRAPVAVPTASASRPAVPRASDRRGGQNAGVAGVALPAQPLRVSDRKASAVSRPRMVDAPLAFPRVIPHPKMELSRPPRELIRQAVAASHNTHPNGKRVTFREIVAADDLTANDRAYLRSVFGNEGTR